MILDNYLMFTGTSNGASGGVSSGANTDSPASVSSSPEYSSNIVDIGLAGLPTSANGGGARDLGIGDDPALKLLVRATTTFTSGGASTLQIELRGAPDDGSGVAPADGSALWTTMWSSGAVAKAKLLAGIDIANIDVPRPVPGQPLPRFFRLKYTTAVADFTAGAIEGTIVLDRDDQIVGTGGALSGYPAGINIAN